LVIAVVLVWGTNFVVAKWGLSDFPAFVFASLRFFFTVFPLIFFVPRPAVGWLRLAAFGLFLGAGQFGALFFALQGDVSPGLASLLMQVQVFFTIVLARTLLRETISPLQMFAIALGVAGIAVIGWQALAQGTVSVTPRGLVVILFAAFCWASANLIARRAGRVDALAFIVWSCPFSLPPLIALAFASNGWDAIGTSLANASIGGWACVLYQSIGNTMFGFGAWSWLMARHSAATVAPWSLLVPVVGLSTSAWLLGETLEAWKMFSGMLVVAGLAMNAYAAWAHRRASPLTLSHLQERA
jgi:O-acetylserine/cysteine efflux transporter